MDLKDMFSGSEMEELGEKITKIYDSFQKEEFLSAVFDEDWDKLELFSRISHIAKILVKMLPNDYAEALKIIYSIIPKCSFAQAMIFPQYIVEKGIDEPDKSAEALAYITPYSTCEFAVRPFIDKYPSKMLPILMSWAKSDSHDVRRLASEGTRLAIPWGAKLQTVNKAHDYALPILEMLKEDPSEYVRKSVANNLNELSKIEPDLVLSVGRKWLEGGSKHTNQLVKYACRTLIKKAYPPAMELFGLAKPVGISVNLKSVTSTVKLNEELIFSFEIENKSKEEMKIRIGYDIGYLKSNGKVNYKINRISERICPTGKIAIERKHKMAETSTRKLYFGRHELKIVINGFTMAQAEFFVEG